MRRQLAAALLALLLGPSGARADRRELYTVLGLEPQLTRFSEPLAASADAMRFTPALELAAFYGLTNSLHVGAALRLSQSRGLEIRNADVFLPDHSPSSGSVSFDHRSIGFGVLGYYRLDTGRSIAPGLAVEAGFASHAYSAVNHSPTGASFGIPYPSTSEFRPYLRATLGAEYRCMDHLYASLAVGASFEPGGLAAWQLVLPLRVGWIW